MVNNKVHVIDTADQLESLQTGDKFTHNGGRVYVRGADKTTRSETPYTITIYATVIDVLGVSQRLSFLFERQPSRLGGRSNDERSTRIVQSIGNWHWDFSCFINEQFQKGFTIDEVWAMLDRGCEDIKTVSREGFCADV